jgi:hypothetical protein
VGGREQHQPAAPVVALKTPAQRFDASPAPLATAREWTLICGFSPRVIDTHTQPPDRIPKPSLSPQAPTYACLGGLPPSRRSSPGASAHPAWRLDTVKILQKLRDTRNGKERIEQIGSYMYYLTIVW